ncbi:hypothetical protein BEP19_02985 [Ammoniphilus oxalaticus]|uniref:Uncharacterized protein n=1 Tax=Ammoniphilus oxalaticus TaxID=66863 RepID=A0A419SNV3_9BACL|nr:hypothetical protein BEP19_02985 [Ammoniphilus oxalaticus]
MWGDHVANLKKLIYFLNQLEKMKIYYKLNKVRNEAIMVEVAVPGQRWEIEFMEDGTIEIEKFISDQDFYDSNELDVLLRDFSD